MFYDNSRKGPHILIKCKMKIYVIDQVIEEVIITWFNNERVAYTIIGAPYQWDFFLMLTWYQYISWCVRCVPCSVAWYSRQAASWCYYCADQWPVHRLRWPVIILICTRNRTKLEPFLFLRTHGTLVKIRWHAWEIYWSNLLTTVLVPFNLDTYSINVLS